MNNNIDKEKLYKLLGAEQFQEVVFKLEDLKYTIIEILPFDLYKHYSNICDKIANRKIKNLYSESGKKKTLDYYRDKKIKFKKELVSRKNRNYHLNTYNYKETIEYLNVNKDIHLKGIKNNVVLIIVSLIILSITSGVISNIALLLLIANIIGSIINFECINLQNYNLYRIEKQEVILKKLEEKQIKSHCKNYNDVTKIIINQFNSISDIPTSQDIINNINNKKQLEQLKLLINKEINNRKNNSRINNKEKIKKL